MYLQRNNQILYKPETVDQFLEREARQEDEFQKLLHRCFENQRRMRKAKLFGYWFTCIGLSIAGALYLIRWNHWWGY